MSNWISYGMENKIKGILSSSVYGADPNHHLGRPFLSAYQIAIEYENLYPSDVKGMKLTMGGKGSGVGASLPQYIARELSQSIKNGSITYIEGAFFSNKHLNSIVFNYSGGTLTSSSTAGNKDLSIFRLKEV